MDEPPRTGHARDRQGRDGEKMSKSKGNVVSPREIIASTARTPRACSSSPRRRRRTWIGRTTGPGPEPFLGRVWRLLHASLPRIEGVKAGGAPDELRTQDTKDHPQGDPAAGAAAVQHRDLLADGAVQCRDPDWTGDPGSLREALEVLVHLLSPFAAAHRGRAVA